MDRYYGQGIEKNIAQQQAVGKVMHAYQPSIREALETQLQDARRNVARLEELLSLFDRNPDLQRAMELMGRY